MQSGGGIRSGPLVGKVARSPLPSRGSPPLHSGGAKSEVAHLWAKWLRHPYRLGDPHHCTAGGQNQKWPTCGQSGYVTPAVSGIPTTAERGGGGGKIRSGPLVGKVATSPLPSLGSPALQSGGGGGSEVAHLWAKWLRHPCRLGRPHHCRMRGKIRSGPLVGKVATSPLLSRGSPPLQSGGQNQKWPRSGQSGYGTPAVSGMPTAAKWGAKSEVAHLWAKWLHHPYRLGDPHHCKAGGPNQKWPTCGQSGYVTPAVSGIPTTAERGGGGGRFRSGPQVGKVATPPLPSRGSPPLQSGGGNQKWPTCGLSGYVTPAVSGIPTTAERGGGGSEVAHLWEKWLRHPCRLRDPHHCRAGGGGGGKVQKWPTSGQSGYATLAVSGIPTASERGRKSEVAHLWAKWLRHPCRLGDPHHCGAGGGIRSGPLVGKVATSPLPLGDPHDCTTGGGESEVAHMWAKSLRHPCRLGDPHHYRAGGEIRSGPQVGKVATSPLPSRGSPPLQSGGGGIRSGPQVGKVATSPLPSRSSPPLQSGGQNQKWPTCGQSGYFTPAVSGIPTTAERGGKSEVAHLWAKWLRHPCRLRDAHHCTAGREITSGPLVGKVATSGLPFWGSPFL